MLGMLLLALAGSVAARTSQPLHVNATGEGKNCLVTVYGELVTDEALRELARRNGKTAVLETDLRTPYECVGGSIVRLQENGFQVLDVTANGVSIMRH